MEEDAQKVRTIFHRYLALGSIGLLIENLDRLGIRPKVRAGRDGDTISPARFMVGPLAYLLKNRFYIGEVVYRGEVHEGEQTPIIDKELFEVVQAKLAERAVRRKLRRSRSPSFLCGLLFDDRCNRMSPSHANKKGVRYRYYVSQALLQMRKSAAGSISRISAPDLEGLVVAAIRHHAAKTGVGNDGAIAKEMTDRDLVATHAERIVLQPKHVEIELRNEYPPVAVDGPEERAVDEVAAKRIKVPWAPRMALARKGIVWKPSIQHHLDPANCNILLGAIARARSWMDDLIEGRVGSFHDIAIRENKVERHIRRLVPLAFLSPRLVEAIVNGTAPAHLTVTSLASALPHSWAGQENKLGIL